VPRDRIPALRQLVEKRRLGESVGLAPPFPRPAKQVSASFEHALCRFAGERANRSPHTKLPRILECAMSATA
jgi:hypothetical protein